MKTLKHSLILLLSVVVFASCSKKEDAVNPDAGVEVSGTYTVTQLRTDDGKTYSIQPGYTKKIEVVRLSENKIDMTIEFNEPNKTPNRVHITDAVTLNRAGQIITLHTPSGDQVGEYSARIIQLKFVENGQAGTFVATKQ